MPASDWLDMCPQTICWQPMLSRNQYGKPVYGPAQTFRGRRVFKNTRVSAYERGTKGQGAEVISESQIWVLALPNIKYEDKVYVQGDTAFPPVLNIQRYPDEQGDLFTKVYLGSSNG